MVLVKVCYIYIMRFLRIYPLLLSFLIFHQAFYKPIDIWGALILRIAPATLWTIRVEIGYYYCIPFIVTGNYHAFNSNSPSKFKKLLLKSVFLFSVCFLLSNYDYVNSFGYGYFTVFFPGSLFGIINHESKKEESNKILGFLTHTRNSTLYRILAFSIMCFNILLEYPGDVSDFFTAFDCSGMKSLFSIFI